LKILVPGTLAIDWDATSGCEFLSYDPSAPIPPSLRGAEVLVAWGNSKQNLECAANEMPRLVWVQSLAAGVDPLLDAGFAENVVLCSGRSLHDTTVSEHALALLLALVRDLPGLGRAQQRAEWSDELRVAQVEDGRPGPVRTLDGATVAVWGFGSIGRKLAPLLTALGANVTAIVRSAPGGDEDVATGQVKDVLPHVDVLVMVLPGTSENRHALGRAQLHLMRPGTWLVNVGRGSTVDERAVVEALDAGLLAGAALDVFDAEPLPATSPLWSHPRVLVTPHVAGGRPRGAAELFAYNLGQHRRGQPLLNEVTR